MAACPFDSYKSHVASTAVVWHACLRECHIERGRCGAGELHPQHGWLSANLRGAAARPGETVLIPQRSRRDGSRLRKVGTAHGRHRAGDGGHGCQESHAGGAPLTVSPGPRVREAVIRKPHFCAAGCGGDDQLTWVLMLPFNSLGAVRAWSTAGRTSRAFGRFIEIGKKDILARNRLQMSPFEQNVDRPCAGHQPLQPGPPPRGPPSA